MLGYKATELDIDFHYNITYRTLFLFLVTFQFLISFAVVGSMYKAFDDGN